MRHSKGPASLNKQILQTIHGKKLYSVNSSRSLKIERKIMILKGILNSDSQENNQWETCYFIKIIHDASNIGFADVLARLGRSLLAYMPCSCTRMCRFKFPDWENLS